MNDKVIKAFWFRSHTNFQNKAKTSVIAWDNKRVDIHTRVLVPLNEATNMQAQGYRPLKRFKFWMLLQRTVHIHSDTLQTIGYGLFSSEEIYAKGEQD
jgi:hypothetical protein